MLLKAITVHHMLNTNILPKYSYFDELPKPCLIYKDPWLQIYLVCPHQCRSRVSRPTVAVISRQPRITVANLFFLFLYSPTVDIARTPFGCRPEYTARPLCKDHVSDQKFLRRRWIFTVDIQQRFKTIILNRHIRIIARYAFVYQPNAILLRGSAP